LAAGYRRGGRLCGQRSGPGPARSGHADAGCGAAPAMGGDDEGLSEPQRVRGAECRDSAAPGQLSGAAWKRRVEKALPFSTLRSRSGNIDLVAEALGGGAGQAVFQRGAVVAQGGALDADHRRALVDREDAGHGAVGGADGEGFPGRGDALATLLFVERIEQLTEVL